MTRSAVRGTRALGALWVAASLALIASACTPAASGGSPTSSASETAVATPDAAQELDASGELSALEQEYGARVGVYAIDTGSGDVVAYRGDERFAYASTMKALLAAAILQQVDDLDRVVPYSADVLVSHSPVTSGAVGTGLSVRDLAEAAVRVSDNTAANLLLDQLGGPEGFAAVLAEAGDATTNPVRVETELNTAVPGDPRDTSTPRALVESLRGFALGGLLTDARSDTLIEWMSGNATGDTLIRAGAPDAAIVADKSGTGGHGTRNDLGIVWPVDGEPIVIAVLTTRGVPDAPSDDALVADAAAAVLGAFG